MPVYRYQCEKCGEPTLKKLLSAAPGFCLRGGGWYGADCKGGKKE